MLRCAGCNKKLGLMRYPCRSCQGELCVSCRLPEDHSCPNLTQMKQHMQKQLHDRLDSERVKDDHGLR